MAEKEDTAGTVEGCKQLQSSLNWPTCVSPLSSIELRDYTVQGLFQESF